MRLSHIEPQLKRNYLYEGLDSSEKTSVMLWETAGIKLKEAALTADQIQNLFKEIETSATAAGGNRTVLGKGKDAATAVNKAWEDLKTKIQDSGPIKGFDKKVSDALSKIGMGADDPEFEGQVNKWVQKYRDFAKEHPIAQGAIYATLIALAGITGAGVGGAVALGLLKMSDQLLQGKRFSSAAYSGVKAGAMAFAASKLGDYIKGLKQGDQVPQPGSAGELPPGTPKMDFNKYDYYVGDSNNIVAVPKGAPNPFTGDVGGSVASSSGNVSNVTTSTSGGVQTTTGTLSGITSDQIVAHPAFKATYADQIAKFGGDTAQARQVAQKVAAAAARKAMLKGESQSRKGKKLSEGQVYLVFNRVCAKQLNEGPLDAIKGLAGKAADKAKTFGKNLTTKVTADKLNKAWQSAGSPTDSEELKSFLISQGVSDDVVANTYQSLKIADTAASVDAPAAEKSAKLGLEQINKILPTLRTRDLLSIQKTVLNAIASKQTAST
jgi:hypothetical protein